MKKSKPKLSAKERMVSHHRNELYLLFNKIYTTVFLHQEGHAK